MSCFNLIACCAFSDSQYKLGFSSSQYGGEGALIECFWSLGCGEKLFIFDLSIGSDEEFSATSQYN